jgi:hypothetical protein
MTTRTTPDPRPTPGHATLDDDVVIDLRDPPSTEPGRSAGAAGADGDGDDLPPLPERDLVPSVRALLLVAALLVFLAGVQLFLFPLRTDEWFAWTIASPMTAVFLGASYWSAVALELTAARARRWSDARIAVPAVFVFTTVTLVVTLLHLDKFHLADDLPGETRAVTWAWIAVYAVVPVLMVAAVVRQRATSTAIVDHRPLPTPVRVVLAAEAVAMLAFGTALLVAPTWADGAWPWTLTPLTARAVGAWLLGLGVAAGHAYLVDDVRAVRPLAITAVVFGIFQTAALLRFGDELDWSSPTSWGYAVALVVIALPGVWTLAVDLRSHETGPARALLRAR